MLDCTFAYGLSFLFPAGDTTVGPCLRNHGEFARTEFDYFVELADGAGTFIDVGANIGAIALPFAKQRPQWKVIAVEAHRGLSGILAANAMVNGLHNVEVFHAAVGAERKLVEFPTTSLTTKFNFGTLSFERDTGSTETVRMLTLDELAPADTRLIKIDVEGFEPTVLRGAKELLRRRTAIWLAEATPQNPVATKAVIRAFQDAGYSTYWFYAPFVTPIAEKGRPANAMIGDPNVVALPPGTPNTWALPPVNGLDDQRPDSASAYPYLARYGYV
jgi:FkbM family methyltransferase